MSVAAAFERLMDMAGRVTLGSTPRSGKAETVGARISRLRRERGISQTELGKRVRTSQRVMSHYEKGEIRIPAETLLRIAEILKVSIYELLGRASSTRSPTDRRLWKIVQKLESLPRRDQKAVMRYIDLLAQANGNGRG